MTLFHAVVHIDHHTAQVVQFDADHTQAQKIHEHTHYTRQHGSEVRSEHGRVLAQWLSFGPPLL